MTNHTIATRRFTMADQHMFATLTGDVNPMHIDMLAARRTQAGICVVHGINAMLWAIDRFLAEEPDFVFTGIAAQFERFVAVDEEIELTETAHKTGRRLDISQAGVHLLRFTLRTMPFRAPVVVRPLSDATPDAIPAAAVVRSYEEARIVQGRLTPAPGELPYPYAVARLGAARMRGLAALSTLVGMVAPGLHSIFSSLELDLDESPEAPLEYRATMAHDGFHMIGLSVAGTGFAGRIQAMVRQPPVVQPKMAELQALIDPAEFDGLSALIIGGSRGLGEVSAKLLAAGGARVAISYAVGRDDAEAVAADIRSAGGVCNTLRYDVREAPESQLASLSFPIDQLYYFATGKIFLQKTELFSPAIYADFHRIYVDGFAALSVMMSAGRPLRAFYPSSVAVEERPRGTTEYAMAKAAAEILCRDLDRFSPQLSILDRRLPRLLTDQTATVTPIPTPPATDVMLRIIREMMPAR